MAVLLLFIDGVGLGDEADYNPWFSLPTPSLRQILSGQPLTKASVGVHGNDVQLLATDACLGVPGLPQSATGQATIFTGRNAPKFLNRHMSGLPFQRLRQFIREDNLYLQLERAAFRPTFANAYTEEYFQRETVRRGWMSVTTVAIKRAKATIRFMDDLRKNKAVYHDLTRAHLRAQVPSMPKITPEEAADHLLDLLIDYDVVVHEFFLSDVAGHKQTPGLIEWVVETYDRFLGQIVAKKRQDDTVLLVSDHGNSEDLRVKTHTDNPVPTLIVGPAPRLTKKAIDQWDLTDIAPLVLRTVGRN